MVPTPGSFHPAPEDPPSIPDYELVRRIGQGGYGDVWLARGITGAWRAVKIVWRARFSDTAPFERELRGVKETMAISAERGQLALLHAGQNERAGFFYYVMELADDAERGREIDPARYVALTLKELRARRKRLAMADCIRIGVEVARALAVLHSHGLLHRDIKPSNIILVNGVAKLADIGLVSSAGEAFTYVGTEGFVPPEGPGSPGADVYALGKVLYELATGLDRAEFPQMPDELGDAAERRAFFGFNEVLLRACDPSPAGRYRNAAAMVTDLEALQAGRPLPVLRRRMVQAVALAAAMAVVAAILAWPPWKEAPRTGPAAATLRPANAATTAGDLVAKAWEALHRAPEPFRAELEVAGEFCRRAAELDGTDARVWAAWSYVESWYIAQNIDRSPERQQSAMTKAARAMSLAPDSFEARLAQACSFLRAESFNSVTPYTGDAEQLLRALLRERPDEPRALLSLAHLLYGRYAVDESAALFERLALQPGWAATAHMGRGWLMQGAGRWSEAQEAAERSIAEKPFFGNLGLVAIIARTWLGDLELAKHAVDQMPAADLREDIGLLFAVQVYWWRREPKRMLSLLRHTPRDWVQSNAYWGPKDYWIGLAHDMMGAREAAQFSWRAALRLVEQRMPNAPDYDHVRLHFIKGRLHALLGEREAAFATFAGLRRFGVAKIPSADAALLGDFEGALIGLEHANWAYLRYMPELDPLRRHAGFQAILEAAARDPMRCPRAGNAKG